ncbi:proline dehydrogenase [Actinomadura sp. CNU-125]|uniref:proline dehydrogenase family protein n=1 Tax=Actinomadura sp. CNU-125 TaxID=1904961 RepID=UPI0009616227|nr:proline dehydrogenase family protein [Actinomadura sp. CNU-125]OLT34914.1 proline dehydrogenase [Actinomadura sp. CNU-125]
MFRRALLAASHSGGARRIVETAPFARDVARRFIAGETAADAARVTEQLTDDGLLVSLDVLGEDVHDKGRAETNTVRYIELLDRLGEDALGARAEVSVKLTAVGQSLDEEFALENARRICDAAASAGTTVTFDMEEHETVDSTLRIVHELRRDHPTVGAVVQAYLRRAEEYCADLAYEGSRVRLCKGAYAAPEAIAFTEKDDIDKSFVRCMKVLMAGKGYPMLATHDPRLIDIAEALTLLHSRDADTFEYQMLYGVRPQEQRRLAADGAQVRVYVAYGRDWYEYFMRRLAEKPANLRLVVRSLVGAS